MVTAEAFRTDAMPQFHPPPETIHGSGSITELRPVLERQDWQDPLLVTDAGVRDAGVADEVAAELPGTVDCFDAITPNPTRATVREISDVASQVDVVVAVGGGSVMDAAKTATALPAFEAPSEGVDAAFERLLEWPVAEPAPEPGAAVPLVLLPTTAGTGSETGHWAVISDHDRSEKLSVGHPTVGGELAVLDPELTTSLPPYVTAASGFDVIAHAVEAMVATGDSFLTRPFALAAYRMATQQLPVAVTDGDDLQARGDLLTASYLAGVAMNNAGLGAVHAISHAIGGIYDTPHGHTNAFLLPAVVRANAAHSRRAFGTYAAVTKETDAPGDVLARQLQTLREMVGLDAELPGLPESPDWDRVADRAVPNVNMETNPVALSDETVIEICRDTFE